MCGMSWVSRVMVTSPRPPGSVVLVTWLAGTPKEELLKKFPSVAVGQAGVAVDQAGVLAELVVGVRRPVAGGLEPQDLRGGGVAVLPGRQDVVALAQAVVGGAGGGDRRPPSP